jgi:uncharacterized protein DUF2130
MEAATPLRKPHVRVLGDTLAVDGLLVDDDCAVRLVRDSEADPAKVVTDAIEIGARVLDREQVGAQTEWVKAELERATREVDHAFKERATQVADELGLKVDEVFGADGGHLTKALERHFSDGSSAAVQNRVKEVVAEVMAKAREDLVRQFSSQDASNPLADLKARTVDAVRDASQRQDASLRALLEKLGVLEREIQGLRDEREKLEEVAAEREKGTAKGRTYEELVVEALDAIAAAQGDDCDAVGDVKGASGRKGDAVVSIDGCNGPARGRIVFEAKTQRLSKSAALEELEAALAERDADFAVLVVPSDEKVPARVQQLREYNGDRLVVAFDPDDGSTLSLELAYRLARARVSMARAPGDEVDAAAVHEAVERALAAMEDVRKVKSQLTGAQGSIDSARKHLEEMAERVRETLEQIDALAANG